MHYVINQHFLSVLWHSMYRVTATKTVSVDTLRAELAVALMLDHRFQRFARRKSPKTGSDSYICRVSGPHAIATCPRHHLADKTVFNAEAHMYLDIRI
jgi:hypothetical protein